eukprot:2804636-Prymnesium_polylepis.1
MKVSAGPEQSERQRALRLASPRRSIQSSRAPRPSCTHPFHSKSHECSAMTRAAADAAVRLSCTAIMTAGTMQERMVRAGVVGAQCA